MIVSKVQYTGSLHTEAVHLRSGAELVTDAPTDNHGRGEAFSPTDLVATATACCMLTTMGILAEDRHLSLEGASARVEKIMSEGPRRIAEIRIELSIPSGTLDEKQKTMLENTARTCPVMLSLDPAMIKEISFRYV